MFKPGHQTTAQWLGLNNSWYVVLYMCLKLSHCSCLYTQQQRGKWKTYLTWHSIPRPVSVQSCDPFFDYPVCSYNKVPCNMRTQNCGSSDTFTLTTGWRGPHQWEGMLRACQVSPPTWSLILYLAIYIALKAFIGCLLICNTLK